MDEIAFNFTKEIPLKFTRNKKIISEKLFFIKVGLAVWFKNYRANTSTWPKYKPLIICPDRTAFFLYMIIYAYSVRYILKWKNLKGTSDYRPTPSNSGCALIVRLSIGPQKRCCKVTATFNPLQLYKLNPSFKKWTTQKKLISNYSLQFYKRKPFKD